MLVPFEHRDTKIQIQECLKPCKAWSSLDKDSIEQCRSIPVLRVVCSYPKKKSIHSKVACAPPSFEAKPTLLSHNASPVITGQGYHEIRYYRQKEIVGRTWMARR